MKTYQLEKSEQEILEKICKSLEGLSIKKAIMILKDVEATIKRDSIVDSSKAFIFTYPLPT